MSPSLPTETFEAQPIRLDGAVKPYSIVFLFPDHMLTDHLPSGDGLVAFGFISALARRGHRLHIIAQRAELQNPLPSNVTMHRIAQDLPRGSNSRLRFVLQSRMLVRKILREEKIDLVHQLNPVAFGMSIGMLGLPIPVVLGTFVAKWPSDAQLIEKGGFLGQAIRRIRAAAREALQRIQENGAAAFLVTTPAALSRFSSFEHVADRVHWLAHGIDMTQFTPLPAGANAEKTILFLASTSAKKGVFVLLDAFEIVRRSIPDARLVLAGYGPAYDEVRLRVSKMGDDSNIEIIGRVNRSTVPRLMANAAVYCLPSFGEPYATTVIEAMACAKPVVVSDSGGLPDMISDDGGRRVQTGNAQLLADALVEILSSSDLRAAMGRHNRELAAREYDWPRVIDKLEAAYSDVLNKRRTGTAAR